ncbi:MAG: 1-phosphofructokinase family hexose kinase [Pseudomonadota bacterium]|nr:1-phosphofructokinase family hexose kinase [Pseudomonadota bacterium]
MPACSTVTLTMNPALDISSEVAVVEPVAKLRCSAPRVDPGGGGINVARVMRRLGEAAACVFPAGGATGQRLVALLQGEGVHIVPVAIAGETREDFTVLEKRSGEQYRFVMPGPSLSSAELAQCLDAMHLDDICPAFVVASGSLPPDAPPGFYAEIARQAKAHGRKLVLDTSGAALRAALGEGVYLVKPNLRELRELSGRSLDDEAAMCAAARAVIAAGGAEIVALSLAEKGARLITRDAVWSALAPAIVPVSTVGAGDSFVGALVHALATGAALPEALRQAVAAGTAALLSHGTELCTAENVNRLVPQIVVRQT